VKTGQYMAWSHCLEVVTGQVFYCWQRLITLSFSKLRHYESVTKRYFKVYCYFPRKTTLSTLFDFNLNFCVIMSPWPHLSMECLRCDVMFDVYVWCVCCMIYNVKMNCVSCWVGIIYSVHYKLNRQTSTLSFVLYL
jgi:hypothetical protein